MSKRLTDEAQAAINAVAEVLTVGPPEVLMTSPPENTPPAKRLCYSCADKIEEWWTYCPWCGWYQPGGPP